MHKKTHTQLNLLLPLSLLLVILMYPLLDHGGLRYHSISVHFLIYFGTALAGQSNLPGQSSAAWCRIRRRRTKILLGGTWQAKEVV